jgi:hypothetical protein
MQDFDRRSAKELLPRETLSRPNYRTGCLAMPNQVNQPLVRSAVQSERRRRVCLAGNEKQDGLLD